MENLRIILEYKHFLGGRTMKLTFFGAAKAVTGSCHCVEVAGKKILVDCGLQQGRDERDNAVLDFAPNDIDYVIITQRKLFILISLQHA